MYDPQDYYFKKAKQQGFKARSAFKLDEIDEKFHLIDRQTSAVLDIGCAPGSRMQYTYAKLQKLVKSMPRNGDGPKSVKSDKWPSTWWPDRPLTIIGLDIKKVDLNIPGVFAYVQDITDHEAVEKIFKQHGLRRNDLGHDVEAIQTTLDASNSNEVKKLKTSKANLGKISHFDFIQSDIAPNTMGIKDFDAMRSIWLLEQTLWIYKEFLKPDGKFVIKIFMWPGFDEFVLNLKKTFGGKNIKVYKPKACRSESKETYIIKI